MMRLKGLRPVFIILTGALGFCLFYGIFESKKMAKKFQFHSHESLLTELNPSKQKFSINASVSKERPRYGCPTVPLSELEHPNISKNKIPLILHQIYKAENVPQLYIPLIQECQRINPDFILLLWTDKIAAEFIKKNYPQYQEIFAKYHEGAQKSDFIRVVALYHFGGVYIDMDVECRKPLSKHLDEFDATAIVDQERRLQTRLRWGKNYTAMNSVMISRKNHPFFKYLLDKFPESLKQDHVMWRTGPFFLNDRLLEYNRQKRTRYDRVQMASPQSFSPLLDPATFPIFNQACAGSYESFNSIRRLGCLEWDRQGRKQNNVAELVKDSILVHKFMHLVYAKVHIIGRVDICTLPNIFKLPI